MVDAIIAFSGDVVAFRNSEVVAVVCSATVWILGDFAVLVVHESRAFVPGGFTHRLAVLDHHGAVDPAFFARTAVVGAAVELVVRLGQPELV
jgi:hypothetical protein